MIDLYLISALLTKPGVYGHRAAVERAGSIEEAKAKAVDALTVDGWTLESLDVRKLDLGWYR